ncbi:MAG: hypothetical protein ACK55I_01355, partial [bacterium]
LTIINPANNIVIDVNPTNNGTVTQVSMGVYAKNGDTSITATNQDGTTTTTVMNDNVVDNQATGYTSVETITGTNIKTITIAKDADYYIVDNIAVTKTQSNPVDPSLTQAVTT